MKRKWRKFELQLNTSSGTEIFGCTRIALLKIRRRETFRVSHEYGPTEVSCTWTPRLTFSSLSKLNQLIHVLFSPTVPAFSLDDVPRTIESVPLLVELCSQGTISSTLMDTPS